MLDYAGPILYGLRLWWAALIGALAPGSPPAHTDDAATAITAGFGPLNPSD